MNLNDKKWSLGYSWQLFKACLRFFSRNKDLMFISGLSLVAQCSIAAITYLLIVQKSPHFFDAASNQAQLLSSAIIALSVAFYFISVFINLFFNSILMACAIKRLDQQKCTITQGLTLAFSRIAKIFIWSLFNSSIGMLLSIVSRSNNISRWIFARFLGFTWVVISYFVLPLIIIDDLESLPALKKSYSMFKGRWCKMFSTLGILKLIMTPIAFSLCVTVYFLLGSNMTILILIAVLLCFLFLFLSSTLETIINAALFLNFFKQASTPDFDKTLLNKVLVKQI